MKNYVICSLILFLSICSFDVFAQGPGDFWVENNTDCAYTITLVHGSSGCNSGSCTNTVTATWQAAPNSTTKVDDGSAYGGSDAWVNFTLTTAGGGKSSDGYCNSTGAAPECNSADVQATFIDCNNGRID